MPIAGTAAGTQTCSASRPCRATTIPAEIKAHTASTDANPLFHRKRFAPVAPQTAQVGALPSLLLPPEPFRAYEPSLFQKGCEAGPAALGRQRRGLRAGSGSGGGRSGAGGEGACPHLIH